MAHTRSSVQFLSRWPISSGNDGVPDFASSSYTFGLAGMILALPPALVLYVATGLGFVPILSSLLCLGTLIITTGALHEDGLADTCDGLWGGHSLERKLTIMRDSSIGTYGVLGLILSIGLRAASLGLIINVLGASAAALCVIAAAGLSRSAMLYPWSRLPPARNRTSGETQVLDEKDPNGLSTRFGSPSVATANRGFLLAGLPALCLFWGAGLFASGLAVVIAAAICMGFCKIMRNHIKGHTGDTLGATQQFVEMGLLLTISAAIS